ncbi:FAD-dependent oxidoreductase [Acinetobacter baumannii]
MPEAAGEILSLESCLYTNSPDGHFIVDKHPEMPNVVYACGFSGHGFKFATAIGEALCDLILERSPRTSIAFLSATRFT